MKDVGNKIAARESQRLLKEMAKMDPSRDVAYGIHAFMLNAREGTPSDALCKRFSADMDVHNAMAKSFRGDTRNVNARNVMGELRKTHPSLLAKSAAMAKANLDVGTMANLAQVTGGQSLGYVSLDTQMARGTTRPNSFTLYNSLNKSPAYQVIDFWPYASSTGGNAPGGAFQSTSSVSNGALNTSAGEYELKQVTLKLALNGRSITTALAAQNSFVSVAEQENTNAALTVLETINWSNYWGNSDTFANAYDGIYNTLVKEAPQNIYDYQEFAGNTSNTGMSPQQVLFDMIYDVAGRQTDYRTYSQLTHAFMSPEISAGLQGLVTGQLNNVVNNITEMQSKNAGIVVNGDLQGIRTRFGNIQFPIDLFISARDTPSDAFIIQETGLSVAAGNNITAPMSVTAVAVSGTVGFSSAYLGDYTYAVAGTDASPNESVLTYSAPVSGVTLNGGYELTINPAIGGMNLPVAFRIFRSGLGYTATPPEPNKFRYIGDVVANGTTPVTFLDTNAHIPGSGTIFLLDMDETDNAIDFRYLLPLTKIELFAQSLYMPWAVAMIGAIRLRIPKFHAVIQNIVLPTAGFDPLSANSRLSGTVN